MSFFKKLSQVATGAVNLVQDKTQGLKAVYEKDSWSGLFDVAEKNLENASNSTSEYLENLKRVNEKVITNTAKNSTSSFDAIWRSSLAVSKQTISYIGNDLKSQAIKLYKAWEDVEVAKILSPELNLLYKATSVLSPSDLMTYCDASRDGAIYTLGALKIEIYGEIWLDLNEPERHQKGSLDLLQYVVVNATNETVSDDGILLRCLNVMYKIPSVRNKYEELYEFYLVQNPDIGRIDSPFLQSVKITNEKEDKQNEVFGEKVSKVSVTDTAKDYLEKGKKGFEDLANRIHKEYTELNAKKELEASDVVVDNSIEKMKEDIHFLKEALKEKQEVEVKLALASQEKVTVKPKKKVIGAAVKKITSKPVNKSELVDTENKPKKSVARKTASKTAKVVKTKKDSPPLPLDDSSKNN